jgi:hypothetical protein
MYLNYEFRLEYARDLPQPRFLSGGLGEAPIGGGAMGGMGMNSSLVHVAQSVLTNKGLVN